MSKKTTRGLAVALAAGFAVSICQQVGSAKGNGKTTAADSALASTMLRFFKKRLKDWDTTLDAHLAFTFAPDAMCWALYVAPHLTDGKADAASKICEEHTSEAAFVDAGILAKDATISSVMLSKLIGRSAVIGTPRPSDPKWMPAYDATAIQAAFDRFYVQPKTVRAGVMMQKLFDGIFKDAVDEFAETLVVLSANKGQLDTLTDKMLAAYRDWTPSEAKYNPGFLWKTGNAIGIDGRTLGVILRRHADGTLPTVVTLLRKVLKDYDPKESASVDAKLAAGNFAYAGLVVAAAPAATTAAASPAGAGEHDGLKEIQSIKTDDFANAVRFSADGHHALVITANGAIVYTTDAHGLKQIAALNRGDKQKIHGDLDATGSLVAFDNPVPSEVLVWRRSGSPINYEAPQSLPGVAEKYVDFIRFAGKRLVVVGPAGKLRTFVDGGGTLKAELDATDPTGGSFDLADLSSDGTRLLTRNWGGPVTVWQLKGAKIVKIAELPKGPERSGVAALSANGQRAALTRGVPGGMELGLYEVKDASADARPIASVVIPTAHSGKFSRDGKWLVISEPERYFRLFDVSKGQLTEVSRMRRIEDNVDEFDFSPDGKWLTTASEGAKMVNLYALPARR